MRNHLKHKIKEQSVANSEKELDSSDKSDNRGFRVYYLNTEWITKYSKNILIM